MTTPTSLMHKTKLNHLRKLFNTIMLLSGEYWECGVYQGGSLYALLEERGKKGNMFRAFDTFEGLPKSCEHDNYHKQGDFHNTTYGCVAAALQMFSNVTLYKGFMPETFKGLEDSRIAFALLDVDLYQSYLDCLDFIYPRMLFNGIMVFDDYNIKSCRGATKAVNEFMEDKSEKIERHGRCYYIKKGD